VLQFIDHEVEQGRQAYVVYPVIDESEKTDMKAATTMYTALAEGAFAKRRVALLHGRVPADERDAIMRRFRDGEVDVLVATTVIEVGIDVANATVMLVEHPERFGLSQLHQLRGRVGRGAEASYCILLGNVSRKPRSACRCSWERKTASRSRAPTSASAGWVTCSASARAASRRSAWPTPSAMST
jgi:ATP-dependent DNA helicase RecG